MKVTVALCLLALAVPAKLTAEYDQQNLSVYSEKCGHRSDCRETICSNDHGWWLHCTNGLCLCTHDSFIGKNCTDGASDTCNQIHGNRCQDHNLVWHCLDNVCHCSRPFNTIG